jgi:hypothetical protein
MTRTQLACYALTASAIILAALIVVQVVPRLESPALGQYVLTEDNITLLTTQGIGGNDYIYMLDKRNERLVAYTQRANGEIERIGLVDLREQFSQGYRRFGGDQGGNRRPGR